MFHRLSIRLLAGLLLASVAFQGWTGERGYFGFSPQVATSGFFLDPTVERITIAEVVPGSPAQRAGLRAGDEVVEVEGKSVAGMKARRVRELATRNVGESLRLALRRDGGRLEITMTAVARP